MQEPLTVTPVLQPRSGNFSDAVAVGRSSRAVLEQARHIVGKRFACAPALATAASKHPAEACRIAGFVFVGTKFIEAASGIDRSFHATQSDGKAATSENNGSPGMDEMQIRQALDRHWAASDKSDFDVEHDIYRDDAVLEYPQSGERIRGRRNIQASRSAQPNAKRFTVRRITGRGDLWVTEFILAYDGQPSYAVSIMEFLDGKVARETQYFGDPFEPGPSRAQWVERIG
jgi:SnoaL-like protein